MALHEKIRLLRQTKGLTQEDVAHELKMSVHGYGDIERGDSDIKLSRLQQLADLFEVKLSELIDMNEKTVLNLGCEQKKSHWHFNSNVAESMQLKSELEKQQLLVQMQQKEIENLKTKIAQLQKINALLEKNS
jgi:transcriptional regulator with XRE-family HTH domain